MKLCLVLLCAIALAVCVSGLLDGEYRGRGRGRPGPRRRPGRRHFGRGNREFGRGNRERFAGSTSDSDSNSHFDSDSSESSEEDKSRPRGLRRRMKSGVRDWWTRFVPAIPDTTHLFPSGGFPDLSMPDLSMPDLSLPGFSIDLDFDLDFQSWFSRERRQWWTGPNVCITKEETEENEEANSAGKKITNHHMYTNTVCDESDSAYKCTTTIAFNGKKKILTEIHECCHGFQREKGKKGCTKELEIKPLHETLKEAGASEFADALQGLGMEDLLGGYNFTVFAPEDAAFKDFLPDKVLLQMGEDVDSNVIMVSPELVGMATAVRDTVTSHIVPEMLKTSQLKDEQVLQTLHQNATIRINFYDTPKMLVTANCIPLSSSDGLAEGGVVHTVPSVLRPVTQTLMDIIAADPELSRLSDMLELSGLGARLRSEGQWTVLAPTDAAFSHLPAELQDRLPSGDSCLNKVLQNHVLPNVICSSVIEGHAKTRNLLDKYVNLKRTEDGKLFAGSGQMIVRDVMGTNGVLHIVDDVLIPDEAVDVLTAAEQAGATEFVKLVQAGNMSSALRGLANFTLFIPSNDAIKSLPDTVWDNPQPYMMGALSYHTLPSVERGHHLHNDMLLPTYAWQQALRVKEYHSLPFGVRQVKTVQCARLVKTDISSCSGVAHVVDKVLEPPAGDLMTVLVQDGRFSSLTKLLRKAGLHTRLSGHTPLTLLAPTDQAFDSVPRDKLRNIMKDGDRLKNFLLYHIITDVTCCAGVFDSALWGQREQTLEGDFLSLRRRNNNILVGRNTPVVSCDLTATNGVIHMLDQPITEAVLKYGQQEEEEKKGRRGQGHGRRGNKGRLHDRVRDHLSKVFGVDLDSLWDVSFDWEDTEDGKTEARK